MICPVCKRDLAPTLSICLTCGAMMNDTVREELETKITTTPEPLAQPPQKLAPRKPVAQPSQKTEVSTSAPTPKQIPVQPPAPSIAPSKPIGARFDTADLRVKKTSPTLVEFQTKKATVPEWRLQLQNSVRQKADRRSDANTGGSQSKPRTT